MSSTSQIREVTYLFEVPRERWRSKRFDPVLLPSARDGYYCDNILGSLLLSMGNLLCKSTLQCNTRAGVRASVSKLRDFWTQREAPNNGLALGAITLLDIAYKRSFAKPYRDDVRHETLSYLADHLDALRRDLRSSELKDQEVTELASGNLETARKMVAYGLENWENLRATNPAYFEMPLFGETARMERLVSEFGTVVSSLRADASPYDALTEAKDNGSSGERSIPNAEAFMGNMASIPLSMVEHDDDHHPRVWDIMEEFGYLRLCVESIDPVIVRHTLEGIESLLGGKNAPVIATLRKKAKDLIGLVEQFVKKLDQSPRAAHSTVARGRLAAERLLRELPKLEALPSDRSYSAWFIFVSLVGTVEEVTDAIRSLVSVDGLEDHREYFVTAPTESP